MCFYHPNFATVTSQEQWDSWLTWVHMENGQQFLCCLVHIDYTVTQWFNSHFLHTQH